MVPSSWLTVVLFLLLVSPGLLFDLLAARRRTGPAESAFHETSRIVLASLGFTAVALAVLSVIGLLAPGLLPDPKGLLDPSGAYPVDHWPAVLGAVAAEAVVAHGAAVLAHWLLTHRCKATIRPMSAWTAVLRRDRPPGHHPYVRLRLTGGAVYTGTMLGLTSDVPLVDRELVLGPPLYSKTGDNPLAELPPDYKRVVIRGATIEVMSVEYRRSDDGQADAVGPPPGAGVGDLAEGDLA